MKSGDLVTYLCFKKYKTVRKVEEKRGMLYKKIDLPARDDLFWLLAETSRSMNPGWKIITSTGIVNKKLKFIHAIDYVPDEIKELYDARNFLDEKIKEWEDSR